LNNFRGVIVAIAVCFTMPISIVIFITMS